MEEKVTDCGHWLCDIDVPVGTYGFIYEIESLRTGQKYIGKKQMSTIRKMAPLKGRKNKRHKIVETDWKSYTGSCNILNEEIEQDGKHNFVFTILRLCSCKWSYLISRLSCSLREMYYYQINTTTVL